MTQTTPSEVRTTPDGQLLVTWDDGHVSRYSLAGLRADCPCATCRPPGHHRVRVASPRTIRFTRNALRGSGVLLALIFLGLLATAETIIVTGPVLITAGVTLAVAGCVSRYRLAICLGVTHLLLCAFVFFLIGANHWGPGDAYLPLIGIDAAYLAAALPVTWHAYRHPPAATTPAPSWHCRHCNYLLVGLTEHRCPECGRGFDPADLPTTPPPPLQSAVT